MGKENMREAIIIGYSFAAARNSTSAKTFFVGRGFSWY